LCVSICVIKEGGVEKEYDVPLWKIDDDDTLQELKSECSAGRVIEIRIVNGNLERVPASILGIGRFKRLNLTGNKIEMISVEVMSKLLKMTGIGEINLTGNPIEENKNIIRVWENMFPGLSVVVSPTTEPNSSEQPKD
jgi:hypothetical protein